MYENPVAILNQKSKRKEKSVIHELKRLGKLTFRVVITFVTKYNMFLSVRCRVGDF